MGGRMRWPARSARAHDAMVVWWASLVERKSAVTATMDAAKTLRCNLAGSRDPTRWTPGLLKPEKLSLCDRELLVGQLARSMQVGQFAEPLQVAGGWRSCFRPATIRGQAGGQEPEDEQPDYHEAEQSEETNAGRIAHASAEASERHPPHRRVGAGHVTCTNLVGDDADDCDYGQRDQECAKPAKNGSIHQPSPSMIWPIITFAAEPSLNQRTTVRTPC